jgi:hypothetical protein
MRLVGIYHLLCDHCNLLFTGFVVPGTLHPPEKASPAQETELHRFEVIKMSPKRPFTMLAILICVVFGVAQGQQQQNVCSGTR